MGLRDVTSPPFANQLPLMRADQGPHRSSPHRLKPEPIC